MSVTESSPQRAARQSSLIRAVSRAIQTKSLLPDGVGIVVGVSGGPDSLCLLHVLLCLAPECGWDLVAAHLNHQLRGSDSDGDARHVAKLCEAWGVSYVGASRDIRRIARETKRSVEEMARIERYHFLAHVADDRECSHVCVAHHADDQVETVLMHLLRGAGLEGLRGMLPSAPLSGRPDLRLVRPLLGTSRDEILAYCQEQGIETRLDRSNLDTTYHRNRIRHELLPTLESYNPNIRQALLRSAESITGDCMIVQTAVDQAWPQIARSESDEAIALDRAAMRALTMGMARRILRKAISKLRASLRDISWIHVEDAQSVAREGNTGDRAALPGGLMLVLDYDLVWVAEKDYAPPISAPTVTCELVVALPGKVALANGWLLAGEIIHRDALPDGWRDKRDPNCAYVAAAKLAQPLVVRPRRTGDRFVPLGSSHEQSLRRYMINAKIPAAQRDLVPLLVSDGRIAWVVGRRLDARFALTEDTEFVMMLTLKRATKENA